MPIVEEWLLVLWSYIHYIFVRAMIYGEKKKSSMSMDAMHFNQKERNSSNLLRSISNVLDNMCLRQVKKLSAVFYSVVELNSFS